MFIVRKIRGKTLSFELNYLKGASRVIRARSQIYSLDLREEQGRLRIAKFRFGYEFIQPKAAQELFKVNIIYLSKDAETTAHHAQLTVFFRSMGARVYLIDLCRYCAIDGYMTGTTSRFLLFHGEKICLVCAKREIEQEMKFRNISFSPKILDILRRVRDVDKVLKMFDPASDAVRDPRLSLIDTVPADTGLTRVPLKDVSVPGPVYDYLVRAKISYLLPVQARSLNAGLLSGMSQLVSSATASGKTLVAEMAGVMALSSGKRFFYLTPLVALANQKYEEFRRKFGKNYGVSIRVGMSRIKSPEDPVVIDTDIGADIVVATYEALDFVLRSGGTVGDIGCVVIDEIHMLGDPDRGYRLAGLIARLKTLCPLAQIVGLSATIGNTNELARELDLLPIVYEKRPIPLERHIIFKQDNRKQEVIKRLVEKEWIQVSGTGYHGQTMVFTNSRLKCSQLSGYLAAKGIKAAGYHSGLSYAERKRIERGYWRQELQCVVTTAALSAGVDFPASTVILESMVMGIESLSVGEFHQMLGRAGRPGYHERGKVYLLVDPLKQARGESEDTIAFSLLDGTVEDVEVELDDERELEELLACMATGHTPLSEFNEHALWPLPLEKVQVLEQHGMVKKGSLTQLGRAVSSSFLSVKEAMRIRASMRKDPLDIVVELLPYESVYLSQGLHSMLKTGSFRLFSGEVLEKLENADSVSRLPSQGREMILKIMMAFFACDCGDPFCEHPAQEFARLVLDLRMSGMSPRAISAHFGKEYDLLLYAGDIFSYLDQTVHKLEAVGRIASAMGRSEVVSRVRTLSKKIEG